MKILNKKDIPNQICKTCGAEVKLNYKDLEYDGFSMSNIIWKCPLCKTQQDVKFKKI